MPYAARVVIVCDSRYTFGRGFGCHPSACVGDTVKDSFRRVHSFAPIRSSFRFVRYLLFRLSYVRDKRIKYFICARMTANIFAYVFVVRGGTYRRMFYGVRTRVAYDTREFIHSHYTSPVSVRFVSFRFVRPAIYIIPYDRSVG